MKITIDTNILKKENISIEEFLVMLIGLFNYDYKKTFESLVKDKKIGTDTFTHSMIVLSDQQEERILNILINSDSRISDCPIDFERLAIKLQNEYPEGIKSGTTYSWRGTTEEIVNNLKALIFLYDFTFTEEEAINAVREYVASFKNQKDKYMSLLKYFVLKSYAKENSETLNSMMMTIIENNREKQTK